MGRFSQALDRLWTGPAATPSTSDSRVIIPSWSGDVAQVSSLPAGIAEAFGVNVASERVSRQAAMAVPPVKRGRNVIAGTIGTAPLVCTRRRAGKDPERVDRQLLIQPSSSVTLAWQLTWTVDTMMFYGLAWWLVEERDALGYPSRASWVQPWRVSIASDRRTVLVDGQPVADRDLIRFDGPDEGLLIHGSRAILTYAALEDAVRKFSRLDVPLGWFQDDETALAPTEVQTYLDLWEQARKTRTTGYSPRGMKYNPLSALPQGLQLAEARSFQAAEIARLMNLPAAAVNAPTGDSLTYATTEGNRREIVDYALAQYIRPIEQRLSMPDVTPAGQAVTVDLGRFLRGDLKSVLEAGGVAVDKKLMTPDEVRDQWLDLPPLGDTSTTDATEEDAA